MLAKPVPNSTERARQAMQQGAQRLSELVQCGKRVSFVDAVWPVIVETARKLACGLGTKASLDSEAAEGWFDAWLEQSVDGDSVLGRINASCADRPHTDTARVDRAFGDAWRGLYPQLVALVGRGLLCDTSWPDFWYYAREMERVAFGPPAANARKLVALAEAGIVDLGRLTTPTLADVEIDCVIAAPHEIAAGSLLDQLLSAGLVRRHPYARGIEVRQDGATIGSDGSATEGLAVIGRATEGVVLGNDTLSRKLHSHPAKWGASVARRAAATIKGGATV